jgi:hypothetical protein
VQFLRKFDKFSRPSSVSQRGTLCCTRCHRISAHVSTTKQTIEMKFNKLFYIGTDVQFSPENSVAGAFIRNIVISVPSPLIRFPSGSHPGQRNEIAPVVPKRDLAFPFKHFLVRKLFQCQQNASVVISRWNKLKI